MKTDHSQSGIIDIIVAMVIMAVLVGVAGYAVVRSRTVATATPIAKATVTPTPKATIAAKTPVPVAQPKVVLPKPKTTPVPVPTPAGNNNQQMIDFVKQLQVAYSAGNKQVFDSMFDATSLAALRTSLNKPSASPYDIILADAPISEVPFLTKSAAVAKYGSIPGEVYTDTFSVPKAFTVQQLDTSKITSDSGVSTSVTTLTYTLTYHDAKWYLFDYEVDFHGSTN